MVAHKSHSPERLPVFGLWERTTEDCLPTAGATRLGLWLHHPGQSVMFFCVIFRDRNGDTVDPAEDTWDHYTCHPRQGGDEEAWDDVIPAPDYWADCRFLLPGGAT